MVCISRPYQFNIFKGCLPQILLGQLLNNLNQFLFEQAFHRKLRIEKLFLPGKDISRR